MAFITIWAGYLNIVLNYLPQGKIVLVVISIIVIVLMITIFILAFKRWYELLIIKDRVKDKYDDLVVQTVEE